MNITSGWEAGNEGGGNPRFRADQCLEGAVWKERGLARKINRKRGRVHDQRRRTTREQVLKIGFRKRKRKKKNAFIFILYIML